MVSKETLDIANRVVSLRKAKDISQAELARKIGLTKGALSQFERGIIRLSAEHVGSMARVLFTSADYLILGKENKEAKSLCIQLFEKILNHDKFHRILELTDDKEITDLIDQMQNLLDQEK